MIKTAKKILSLILSAVMVISLFAGLEILSGAEDDILKYLSYKIIDGEVTITDCDTSISGDVVIPDTIEGYPVTVIDDYSFIWIYDITNITIPESVKLISKDAFSANVKIEKFIVDEGNVVYSSDEHGVLFNKDKTILIKHPKAKTYTEYVIPDSVTTIGDMAFSNCDSLASITIPDSVTTIGSSAFYWCSNLTSVTIGNGVTTIGSSAFSDCRNLKNITIGSSVTEIDDSAFYSCDGIEKFIVAEDNTVYSSDEHGVLFNKDKTILIMYPKANTNTEYIIPDSVTTIDNSAFLGCSNLTSIILPESVTTIGESAFRNCNTLTSITIPDSVTTIENYLFLGCSNLKSVIIGSGVTTIGFRVFYNCNRLEKFIVDIDNAAYSSDENGILFNKDQTELIMVPSNNRIKKYAVPDSVITIADSAFYECLGLTSITFGKNVKEIGASAFKYCTNLTEINFSENLEIIGDNAFYGCKNIKSITIGDSLKTIGYYAFYDCENLEDVTIGDNVTMVGGEAFNNTSFRNNKDNWENGGFYIGKVLCEITGISGDYEVKAGTKTIAPGAFAGDKLTSVTFPVSVTRICSSAFAGAGFVYGKANEITIYNPYCIIEPDGDYDNWTIPHSAIIKGYKGSTAEEYANNHPCDFVELEGEPPAELNTEKLPTEEYVQKELTTKGLPDPEHDFVGVYVISPTCVEDGVMVYTCYCGKSYEADVKATGHIDDNNDIICDTCNVNINTGEVVTTEPTTKEPITDAPTTEPTTKEPITDAPATEPTTKEPETEAPTTEPTTKEPVTDAQTTEKPTDKPTENPTEAPTQKPTEKPTQSVSEKLEVKDDTVKVDESSKISTVKTKSSADDIIKSVNNKNVSIIDKNGKAISGDTLVGTGSIIRVMDNSGKILNEYTVCVPTDVDGNGRTTAADARLALRGSAKLEKLEGVYALASDVSGDGKITAADARKILRISAGLEKA